MLILISPVGVTNAGIAIMKKPIEDEYIFKTWEQLKTSSEYQVSRLFVAKLIREVKRKPEALYYNIF